MSYVDDDDEKADLLRFLRELDARLSTGDGVAMLIYRADATEETNARLHARFHAEILRRKKAAAGGNVRGLTRPASPLELAAAIDQEAIREDAA